MDRHKVSFPLGGETVELEVGRVAQQANAAVLAKCGDNVILATVVMSSARDDIDYFPLFVEYQEKLYAGGRIKGSRWVKRDGRPSDDSILTARLIDRSIRPLFPKGFKNEVQVIVTTLSVDGVNQIDTLAIYAAAAALSISDVPFDGPVGGVRVGQSEAGELIVNPTYEQQKTSKLDLVVSSTKDAILMVEAGANEVSEEVILKAFDEASKAIVTSMASIEELVTKVGVKKIQFAEVKADAKLVDLITTDAKDEIIEIVKAKANVERHAEQALLDRLFDAYSEQYSKKSIVEIVGDLVKKAARKQTVEQKKRPDGRGLDEIRSISSEVSILPRTHGSAIFNRGATQALTITTLGSPAMEQIIDSPEGEEAKRYIHHYNMPPYTVGEVGRVGWPGRREIGHGALAERALMAVIPSEEDFPYTIQVVSEIMSSNGSTSMASVCGSTLSLMDAGVPIKKPVAGIAMGLIKEGKDYLVLSDIMGFEDHTGDMDFKVAGTRDGITAMQMDVKIKGIPTDVLKRALEQARVGRLHILDEMLKPLSEPRKALSAYAPKIITVKIPVDRIGELIGPGGKVIKNIIAESGSQVDVDDEGNVFITAVDQVAIDKANQMVTDLFREIKVGEEFDGEVVRLMNFGAFVQLIPGKDGLVHVSRMSTEFVSDPASIVNVGDKIHVRVTEIDDMGRVNLSMLTPEQDEVVKQSRGSRPERSGGQNRNFGGNDRNRRDRR